MTAQLVRGANAPLRGASRQPVPRVIVEVSWGASSPIQDVVLLAVACDARGQALSPTHQSTFRSPTTVGSVSRFELLMDLLAVPDDCPHVAFALSTDGSSVRDLEALTVTVRTEQGEELARYLAEDIPDWPGLIIAEIYRRSDQWKVRAIGQGLSEGHSGLLRSFALVA
jgi:hypothetical protein